MKTYLSVILFLCTFSAIIGQSFERGPFTGKAISLPQIADFDGDDKPDVLGISRFFSPTGDLKLHINQSTADSIIFETKSLAITAIGNPGIGDFNSDGMTDIVVMENDSNQVWILINNGDGSFDSNAQDSELAFSFKIADLDGDNDLDIVSINASEESAYLMINDGNGKFETSVLFTEAEDLKTIELADLDDDGDIDVIVGYDGFFDGKILLLENQGNLAFEEKIITETGAGSLENIQIIDINKDGRQDVVFSRISNSVLWAMINNGDNTFTLVNVVQGLGGLRSFNVADYNNDGIWDVLLGCNSADNTFHLGLSDLSFEFSTETVSGIQPMFYIVNSDLDSDGDLDAVLSNGDFWWIINELDQGSVSTARLQDQAYEVFPNPFSDQINIRPENLQLSLLITDLSGMELLKFKSGQSSYNLSELNRGYYLLSMVDEQTKRILQTSKILKID